MSSKLSLQELIEKLHEIFASDHINVEDVQHVMEKHTPDYAEWKKYENFDPHRYTRNLVDTGNGKFNLILLCWGEGHGSGIHDHANAHCWMKIMDGTLTEKLFDWPDQCSQQTNVINDANKMLPRRQLDYNKGQVAYINDSIGLHRIENNDHSKRAVSLHLYSPPFEMCQSFDERTGKKVTCQVTFWSQFGERTPFGKSCSTFVAEPN